MRFIKQHLSLIFPLVMLLFSLESAMLVNRAVLEHEKKLSQDYSIVIASKTPVSFAELQSKVKEAKDMREIDPQVVLKDLEHTISAENLEFQKSASAFLFNHSSYFPQPNRAKENQ